ncbi:MAG: N-acetylneuraminate synthase [Desulfovibrionaceae bacterium]
MSEPYPIIIAEAGVNHDGDPAKALLLVDAAAAAGADFVKFQTFVPELVVAARAAKAEYQKARTGAAESQQDMLRRLALDEAAHVALMTRCAERGIRFLSTPFDAPSIALLARLGLKTVKIPSGEVTNLPYLEAMGAVGWEIIMSTGMADLDEVAAAMAVLERAGTPQGRVTLLHCTTEYPAPVEEANLRAMRAMHAAFPACKVGYSDHTLGLAAPLAAVALGAAVIEKHFTLDRAAAGPDHAASATPEELAALVRASRQAALALGHGRKEPGPTERKNIPIVRKFLVAARPIRAGEAFSAENLVPKRTGAGGVSPMRLPELLGRPARRDYAPDQALGDEAFGGKGLQS